MYLSSPKQLLLSFFLFFILIISGCGNDQPEQESSSNFALPSAITQARFADGANVRAYLQVDGGLRQEMAVSGNNASIEITNLSPGSHQFTITIEYTSGTETLTLAQTSQTVDIGSGNNAPIAFEDSDYDFQAFDDDNDGISNLDEVLTDNADLHAISLSVGDLNQRFDPQVTAYIASVAYSETEIEVTASLQNSSASLTVNGVSTANNTASAPVTLNQGSNTITIGVMSEDGSTTKNYSLTIIRLDPADNNADLQSLQISTGDLNEVFQSDVTNYSATVAYSVSQVAITANPVNNSASLTVNGVSTANNVASSAIALVEGVNTVTVSVTSGDASVDQDYTISITRLSPPADNATLRSLQLSEGSLNESFTSEVTSYTASVAYEVTELQVTANPLNSNASLTVNGEATANDTPSTAMALATGQNTITVNVTSEDGTASQSYLITVTRLGIETSLANADLQSISLSQGVLKESFQPGVTSYTATVAYEDTEIQVTAGLLNSNASMSINGITTANNSPSEVIALAEGSNGIVITVTSEDGTTTKSYTLNVTRLGYETALANADLESISLSSGTLSPVFEPQTTSGYTANVTYETTSIEVTANPQNSAATVTVNGNSNGTVNLAEGDNNVSILVTAEDGVTTNTYALVVIRAGYETALDNDDLESISLSSGTLAPAFAPQTTSGYTANVAYETTSIEVTANPQNSAATVTVNGSSNRTVNLTEGDNDISIAVTAEDGVTTKTYSLVVTRAGYETALANAYLQSISLSSGTLSPTFAPETTSGYSASVAYETTSIEVTAIPQNGSATVTVNGISNGTVNLAEGDNNISIEVTAEDGVTTNTYSLVVTRAGYETALDNANLQSISLSSGTLSPAFAPATTSGYTADVAFEISSIQVTATPQNSSATITINGGSNGTVNLAEGDNNINIVVTAEDGTTTRNYSLTVTRAGPPANDASLQSLQLSTGSFNETFDPTVTSYTASLAYEVSAIQVTANPLNGSASLTVNGVNTANNTASGSIALVEGSNTITVRVTSEDGTATQNYTISVTRLAPTTDIANLSAITLSTGDMDQIFQSTQPYYTAAVGWLISSLQITATAQYSAATVSINSATATASAQTQTIELAEGENLIEMIVTAADNVTQRRYTVTVTRASAQSFAQRAYAKASNTGEGDRFGSSVALDGDTLAVGALWEDGADDGAYHSGAVYVFTRSGGSWSEPEYLKAPNIGEKDYFGSSVALDGDTLAVGATGEDGADDGASYSGAVYVFTRSGGSWSEPEYLKASNIGEYDFFGSSVALDGDTLAVGARLDDGADDGTSDSGAVYVFTRSDGSWSHPPEYLKASNIGKNDFFGSSVALDGDTLVVGATGEDGADDGVTNSGAVYVFTRSGGSWSHPPEYLKASIIGEGDNFGSSVALDGDTLAVGASLEDGADDGVSDSGAVYVFTRSGGNWSHPPEYLKASNIGEDDYFGRSVALEGDTLAVGAPWDDGADDGISDSGAVYVFTRSGGSWSHPPEYRKASNTGEYDYFGVSVALDGDTLAVGAYGEDGPATGVSEIPLDDNRRADNSGAVYVFR